MCSLSRMPVFGIAQQPRQLDLTVEEWAVVQIFAIEFHYRWLGGGAGA
jgi:hypothetical protein